MFEIAAVSELLGKRMSVICTDSSVVEGVWVDWTSAEDNEPHGESILIERPPELIEVYVSEVRCIQKV